MKGKKKRKKKNGFTIRVGPAPLCDLDVIHIFNSGCWLHAHYNAVCFCGVKHTAQRETINEHVRSDAAMERARPGGFLIRCSVGHHAIRDVKRQNPIVGDTTVMFYFQLGS